MRFILGLLLIGVAGSACTKHIGDLDDLGDSSQLDLRTSPDDLGSGGPLTLSLVAGAVGASGNLDGMGRGARFHEVASVAADGQGNLYIADSFNFTIRKMALQSGEVTTFAGSPGKNGSADGIGAAARFDSLGGMVIDGNGNLYVTEPDSHTIRQIVLNSGAVSTLAGSPRTAGSSDGSGTSARFNKPADVTWDGGSNLYVADSGNDTIRQISLPGGAVTTIAGSAGVMGSSDGSGSAARFNTPSGVTWDGVGNLYVSDSGNNTIRQIGLGSGAVTTIAGSAGVSGSSDGIGSAAQFYFPYGLATDGAGNLYVADNKTYLIRKIGLASRTVTTLAGSAYAGGGSDGIGTAAQFFWPQGLMFDGAGDLYIADTSNDTVRKMVLQSGAVTTLAGSPSSRVSIDGTGPAAHFYSPSGVAADGAGNLFISDANAHTIRQIVLSTGAVTTLAGRAGSFGSSDGIGSAARFTFPAGLAADSSGNLFVADFGTHTIRQVVIKSGAVTTIAGMADQRGSSDGIGTAAGFSAPKGVAADDAGNLYVADTGNHTIRQIVVKSGAVTTLAGVAGLTGSDDGIGTAARLDKPAALAPDRAGNLFIADSTNCTIRKMVLKSGVVTTIAGTAGKVGTIDGIGSAAQFTFPNAIAVDNADNLYVAEFATSVVRLITRGNTAVTTLIGVPGQQGLRTGLLPARLNQPMGLTVSPDGKLFVVDSAENAVLTVF